MPPPPGRAASRSGSGSKTSLGHHTRGRQRRRARGSRAREIFAVAAASLGFPPNGAATIHHASFVPCGKERTGRVLYCDGANGLITDGVTARHRPGNAGGRPVFPRAGRGPSVIGRVLGSYRIVGQLGEGGMGAVYLAEHPIIGKQAAIKVLRPECSRDAEMVERFFNE